MSHISPRIILFAGATYLSFSTCDAFARLFMLHGYAQYQALFLVMVFGLIPIFGLLVVQKTWRDLWPRFPRLMALRVTVSCAEISCGYYTLAHLPLTQSYALFFTMPLWVALFSALFLKEHLRRLQWAAIGLGFSGVLVANNIGGETWVFSFAHFMGLMTAMLAAGSLVTVRYLGGKEKQSVLMTAHYFVVIIVSALCLGGAWQAMPLQHWGDILLAGIMGGVAQVLFVLMLRMAPAPLLAPFQYSQVLWGLLFGSLMFADPVEGRVLGGLALIVAGGWWLIRLSKAKPVSVSP